MGRLGRTFFPPSFLTVWKSFVSDSSSSTRWISFTGILELWTLSNMSMLLLKVRCITFFWVDICYAVLSCLLWSCLGLVWSCVVLRCVVLCCVVLCCVVLVSYCLVSSCLVIFLSCIYLWELFYWHAMIRQHREPLWHRHGIWDFRSWRWRWWGRW